MKATRLHPQSEDAFGHEIIVWSWERQLPNAAQTLKVLICYGHTRSLGDCVPEHRVETDSLPETRNQITNTGLSFSRLRTHCTIAPLTKKKRHLGQLPFALQAAARAISLEVLPVACHPQVISSHSCPQSAGVSMLFQRQHSMFGVSLIFLVCPAGARGQSRS